MPRFWVWRLFLGCLVFVIMQVACRSPILPCSAWSGRGREGEGEGGRGRGYGASLVALAPDRGLQTGVVESCHSGAAMARVQLLWPMTLRGGDGEAGVDDEEEEGGESSSLDEMKIYEEAMKRGNEEELTGGIKDAFMKKSGLSEAETAEKRASIEKIIRGEWDREDEFLREKHEGLFEDTNPLQYFSKDPEEQKRLTRQLHTQLFDRVAGDAKPGELQAEELELLEQEHIAKMNAKMRGEEGAEVDEDFGDIVDAIHKEDGPIFGDLDAGGKAMKISSWRKPRKGVKAVDEPLPSSGEEGGDSDGESSRAKQRRKATEAVEAKEDKKRREIGIESDGDSDQGDEEEGGDAGSEDQGNRDLEVRMADDAAKDSYWWGVGQLKNKLKVGGECTRPPKEGMYEDLDEDVVEEEDGGLPRKRAREAVGEAGGVVERDGDIVVPDMHTNVPEAVLVAHKPPCGSKRIVVKRGEHSWLSYNLGRIEVLREMHMVCEPGAVQKGRWLLLEGSKGSIEHGRMIWQTPSRDDMRVVGEPTVYVRGGNPWLFEDCDVRNMGSTAIMVTREGDCTLMHCTLGGPAERTYDLDRDTRCCASEAIQVMGSAWLVVRFCVLTDTYGPGCSFLGETHSYVESCLFQRTAIGATFDYKAKVTIKGSTITDTYECAFWDMPGDDACHDTHVEMIGNAVHGCVWADHQRPGKLILKSNNFNETFPKQFHEIYRADPPLMNERNALGCGWSQQVPDDLRLATGFAY